jgi:ribosomal protein L11 methyltransferase
MATYIQIEFQNIAAEQSDLLLAELTMLGFEGFEEGEENLKAFIPSTDLDEAALKELAAKNSVSFIQTTIEETNWNAVWESNFEPVVVDDFVGLRAHFHESIAGVQHEIVITPKMSFGTGHHATTYMMIQQMRDMELAGKTVFDFGTGTGVLAILAEQLGASRIVAIDNDDWSIENAAENLNRNDCSNVELKKADTAEMGEGFDIILANINKHVILENLPVLAAQLKKDGTLLLSGLLAEDESDILSATSKYALQLGKKYLRNNWISLRLSY